MLSDFKYAIRSLMKTPGFTAVAVLVLALCIGASTAVFMVLKNVVLDPLPFPDPQRLVSFQNLYPGLKVDRGQNSIPDYLDRRQLTDVFESVALWQNTGYELGLRGSPPQRIDADIATPEFFSVLKVFPVLGRSFAAADATPGKDKVAILSHGLWREIFSSDPNVLGREVRLNGVNYRVIGVMPSNFSSLAGPLYRGGRIWVPLAFEPAWTTDNFRHTNSWKMIARLRPGVSVEQAQRRIDALNRANANRVPLLRQLLKESRFFTLVSPVKEELVRDVSYTLYLLQAAAALVLLIGCVNIASLMLVRTNIRMKELAVRFSLGASRGALARQLLTESVAISVAGGLVALIVAFIGAQALSYLGAREMPRGMNISIDASILAFNFLAAVATGFIFSVISIRNLWKQDLVRVFHATDRTGTAERGALRMRATLVASQIAIAFILLAGSGLLVFSFANLLKVNPGFRTSGIATAEIALPAMRYSTDGSAGAFITKLLERLKTVPGVTHAAMTTYLPLSGIDQSSVAFIDGRLPPPDENPPVPRWNIVNEEYFKVFGIPLLKGRTIVDADEADAPLVAVVDEFFARKYWPKGNALGAAIGFGLNGAEKLTVVGVVGSVKSISLDERDQVGQIYVSYKQTPPRQMHLAVRGAAPEAALFGALRDAVARLDPEMPVTDMKTMSQRLALTLMQTRAAMIVCSFFGGLAALLAAVGIYGVLAYSIAQRTREFGIRLALGAQGASLLKAVVWQGLKIAGVGLTVGAIIALGLTRFIDSLLYEIKPTDPLTFSAIAGLLIAVAALACYLPARRVTKVDPMAALRAE